MKIENGYYIWNKGEDEFLSAHFRTIEFSCHCEFKECIEQKISVDLIERLEWVRVASKSAIDVHSGFRCTPYQEKLRNSGVNTVVAKKSTHELGDAADIRSHSLIIPELLQWVKWKFHSYGLAINFIHVDLRPPHADGSPRTWKY